MKKGKDKKPKQGSNGSQGNSKSQPFHPVQPGQVLSNTQTERLRWFSWPGDRGKKSPADQVSLKGCPSDSNLLHSLAVLIIGLGSVGARILELLARAGVGTIFGTDPDLNGDLSWLTQPCRPSDAGKPKAYIQGMKAHEANPYVSIITAQGFAQDLPKDLLRRVNLIILAADNLDVLVWVSKMAAGLSKPVLEGAVFGEQWMIFSRQFDLSDPEAPCPACDFNAKEWSMLTSRFGCDPESQKAQGRVPTRTLPLITSAAADLVAGEALKRFFNMEKEALCSEEIAYCLRSHRVMRTKRFRNTSCRCPHASWNLVSVPESTNEVTLSKLAGHLVAPQSVGDCNDLQVRGESSWVSFTLCPDCSRAVQVRRFGRPGSPVGKCTCGSPLLATPLGVRSVLPRKDLLHCLDVPLASLGLSPGDSIAMKRDERWTYFFMNDTPPWESILPDPKATGAVSSS